MLKIENLKASIGDVEILKGIDLEISSGELHAVMGPNGSGKSTLLKLLSGIHRQTSGTIEIDGSVGPVGGIKQKIIAAKRAGAELILVPVANFEEAKPFEDDKTAIVAVDSFDEALSVISQYSSR